MVQHSVTKYLQFSLWCRMIQVYLFCVAGFGLDVNLPPKKFMFNKCSITSYINSFLCPMRCPSAANAREVQHGPVLYATTLSCVLPNVLILHRSWRRKSSGISKT